MITVSEPIAGDVRADLADCLAARAREQGQEPVRFKDKYWQFLSTREEVQEVVRLRAAGDLRQYESALASLVDTYQELGDLNRRSSPRRAGAREATIDPDNRQRVLGEILEIDAGRQEPVREFRARHLAGGLIGEAEVGEWIRSRSPSFDETVTFRNIPLPPPKVWRRNHKAGRTETYADRLERTAAVVRQCGLSEEARSSSRFEKLYFIAPDEDWETNALQGAYDPEYDDYHGEPRGQHVHINPGSELWELQDLGRRLAVSYGWSQAEATGFVLTGRAPVPPRASGRIRWRSPYGALSRIELELDPRLSWAEVRELHAKLRRQLRKGGDHEMSERHCELVRFIARDGGRRPYGLRIEYAISDGTGDAASPPARIIKWDVASHVGEPTWPELQEQWNAEWTEKKPEWCYDDAQARQFSRDVRQAWERLTGQPWGAPTVEESAAIRADRKARAAGSGSAHRRRHGGT